MKSKAVFLLGWLLFAGTLLLAAKFSDNILQIGESGADSKILFSGGDGIIQYNNTNDKFEYADDGIAFRDFGSGLPPGESIFRASIDGSGARIRFQEAVGGPWISSISTFGIQTAGGSSRGSGVRVNFVDGFFEKTPICWASASESPISVTGDSSDNKNQVRVRARARFGVNNRAGKYRPTVFGLFCRRGI